MSLASIHRYWEHGKAPVARLLLLMHAADKSVAHAAVVLLGATYAELLEHIQVRRRVCNASADYFAQTRLRPASFAR